MFLCNFAAVMDKIRYLSSCIIIAILSFWMTGCVWTPSNQLSQTTTESNVESLDNEHQEGTAQAVDFDHQKQPYAAFGESQSPFWLASQRPQRLIPVNGTGGNRSQFAALHQFHLSNLWKSSFRQALSALTAMGFATPCDYYVIALRRIIR